uniref:epoxide hydrolase 1-like n=1 Tax=Styela clava TaxID=7725 RepID=UPI00193A8102|nr:epoxide hydrolase 1-like [Styela clava]
MLVYAIAAILAVFVYLKFIRRSPEDYEILSKYYGDRCWTKEDEIVDTSIRPFKIDVSDSEIEDLNKRLDNVRFPSPSLEDTKFTYGVNQEFMKKFVDYWRNSYSWREQEKYLNKYPHFKTRIEGLDIHFVHFKPKTMSTLNQPRPLMLLHGWPGSFLEFYKMIPMLTDPTSHGGNETDLFEVIIPSIPGYGFSQASEIQGLGSLNCARIFHKLMLRLDHKKYYVQGGDWGSVIGSNMAMLYPSAVKGYHFNMINGGLNSLTVVKMLIASFAPNLFFDKEDVKANFPVKNLFIKLWKEFGYLHLQATKPDTVGFALSDSPVGLAAYIVEKFAVWTDPDSVDNDDGNIPKHWTYDELLNNIMIYWLSGNVTSSLRFYKETFSDLMITRDIKVRVPAGFAAFPSEVFHGMKCDIEYKCTRLLSYTRMREGGHFAAFQVPHVLTEDFRQFVRQIERVDLREKMDESEFAQEYKQTQLDRFETS